MTQYSRLQMSETVSFRLAAPQVYMGTRVKPWMGRLKQGSVETLVGQLYRSDIATSTISTAKYGPQ